MLVREICQQLEIHSKDLDSWVESTNDQRLKREFKETVEKRIKFLKKSSQYTLWKTQQQARELYESGMTFKDISQKMSIAISMLYYWKKKLKWNLRNKKSSQLKKWSLPIKIKIIEARKYKNKGFTVS